MEWKHGEAPKSRSANGSSGGNGHEKIKKDDFVISLLKNIATF